MVENKRIQSRIYATVRCMGHKNSTIYNHWLRKAHCDIQRARYQITKIGHNHHFEKIATTPTPATNSIKK